jgi:hypothetical protein
VYLTLDPDTVEPEDGSTRDVRGIGHLGTGDPEVRITSAADLEGGLHHVHDFAAAPVSHRDIAPGPRRAQPSGLRHF